ncbi:MAG: macro domain-containing protein [Clostridia bacterium]|nr:macro domain-containing protein [Clostridia bacterium]
MKNCKLKFLSSFLGAVACFGLVPMGKMNNACAKSNISVASGVAIGTGAVVLGAAAIFGIVALTGGFSKSEDSEDNNSKPAPRSEVPYRVEPLDKISDSYINQIINPNSKIKLDNFEIVQTGGDSKLSGITDAKLLTKSEYGKVAIIDAANNGGIGGGGVDGAIFAAMSQNGCDPVGDISKNVPCYEGQGNIRIKDGGAIIHSSYGIGKQCPNVPYVIQTVSPKIYNEKNLNMLYSALYNVVALGIEYRCDTLMTPAVGMGAFYHGKTPAVAKECAKVTAKAINDAKRDKKSNVKIVITQHDDPDSSRRNDAFFDALKEMIK